MRGAHTDLLLLHRGARSPPCPARPARLPAGPVSGNMGTLCELFGYGKAGPRDLPVPLSVSPDLRLWKQTILSRPASLRAIGSVPFPDRKEELFVPVIGSEFCVCRHLFGIGKLTSVVSGSVPARPMSKWQSAVVTVSSSSACPHKSACAPISDLRGIPVGRRHSLLPPEQAAAMALIFKALRLRVILPLLSSVLFFPAFFMLKRITAQSGAGSCLAALCAHGAFLASLFYIASCSPTLGRAMKRLWFTGRAVSCC